MDQKGCQCQSLLRMPELLLKKLREEHGYSVDKSLLIKEILDRSDVTLLPRPRRFGKILNMTILRYFFEITGTSNAYLFDKL